MKRLIVIFISLISLLPFVGAQEQEYRSKNYPDGGIMYDGYFIGDRPVNVTRYYNTGHIKSVQQFDSNGNSTIRMFYEGASLFAEGGYDSAKRRDGVWKFYTKGGTVSNLVTFRNGVRNGLFIVYTETGLVLDSMNYVDNKLDGERVKYYQNGKRQVVFNFKNGVADGAYTSFFDDGGKNMSGNFKDGLREGVWRFYEKDGSFTEYKFKKGHCKKYDDFLKKDSAEAEIDRHIAEPSFEDFQ